MDDCGLTHFRFVRIYWQEEKIHRGYVKCKAVFQHLGDICLLLNIFFLDQTGINSQFSHVVSLSEACGEMIGPLHFRVKKKMENKGRTP